MPKGLRRVGGGERHFYHVLVLSAFAISPLSAPTRRFLEILEEVRQQFDFVVWGHVVMPERFHLELWRSSSYRLYGLGEKGPVKIGE